MAKKVIKQKKGEVALSKEDDTKIFAFLATFLGIIGFLIALLTKKDNDYVMFNAKQSLIITIVFVIAIVCAIVPVIGWVAAWVLDVIGIILWVISWIYALSGEMKDVPIVGQYARKINL